MSNLKYDNLMSLLTKIGKQINVNQKTRSVALYVDMIAKISVHDRQIFRTFFQQKSD